MYGPVAYLWHAAKCESLKYVFHSYIARKSNVDAVEIYVLFY